jgi:hypothetical protein
VAPGPDSPALMTIKSKKLSMLNSIAITAVRGKETPEERHLPVVMAYHIKLITSPKDINGVQSKL